MVKRRISILVAVSALAAALAVACSTHRDANSTLSLGPSPAPWGSPIRPSSGAPAALPAGQEVWASAALLDRRTGQITTATGSRTGTSTTESMIKIAVAAQYLRDLTDTGRSPDPQEKDMLSRMIRDSDNEAAETIYRRAGRDRMLAQVVATCQLHETRTKPGWWSETQMTAADAARLGACIAEGKVATGTWAGWILEQMRAVRGVGRFGIIAAYPADGQGPLAIKNGWGIRDDGWHINCLAVTADWTLAVMIRFPDGVEFSTPDGQNLRDLPYGAAVCRRAAAALIPASSTPSTTMA